MTERDPRHTDAPADPSGIDQPHDVLAAEEFGIGARDERLPPDPSGIKEPHDVLAAEEFAMPAGAEPGADDSDDEGGFSGPDPRTLIPLALLAALLAVLWARRRS